jgi:hypothetical protein
MRDNGDGVSRLSAGKPSGLFAIDALIKHRALVAGGTAAQRHFGHRLVIAAVPAHKAFAADMSMTSPQKPHHDFHHRQRPSCLKVQKTSPRLIEARRIIRDDASTRSWGEARIRNHRSSG